MTGSLKERASRLRDRQHLKEWTQGMAAWQGCSNCLGTGVAYSWQHEGNDPHSGIRCIGLCECVIRDLNDDNK
jgi:hypothetical protein